MVLLVLTLLAFGEAPTGRCFPTLDEEDLRGEKGRGELRVREGGREAGVEGGGEGGGDQKEMEIVAETVNGKANGMSANQTNCEQDAELKCGVKWL